MENFNSFHQSIFHLMMLYFLNFYFDITLTYFLNSHFSFSLCDKRNVVISKVHYKSIIFFNSFKKFKMISIKVYDNMKN
jgi:hypothetical protein